MADPNTDRTSAKPATLQDELSSADRGTARAADPRGSATQRQNNPDQLSGAVGFEPAPSVAIPAENAAVPLPDPPQSGAPVRHSPLRLVIPLIVLAAFAYGVQFGWSWWTLGRFVETTDDAYVKADLSVLATKIAGYVMAVPANDNAVVHAGDILVQLDDGDYRLALEAAERRLETQRATIERLTQQTEVQNAMLAEAEASASSADAEDARAAGDFKRASDLARSEFGSKKALDAARADRDKSRAAIASAAAAIATARANMAVTKAQIGEAQSQLRELETTRDKARRDLDFATIKAPFDGIVGNRAVQPGQFLQTGSRLMALVPLNKAYVLANFKETQLSGLLPGQAAEVTVDANSGGPIMGIVDSIAPASGSEFSLLPPENATGNFTKIVQRVPVKIWLPDAAVAGRGLRSGLSAIVSIDRRGKPGEPPRPPDPSLLQLLSGLFQRELGAEASSSTTTVAQP